MSPAAKKTIQEHINWENAIKALLLLVGSMGLQSATSDEPVLNERVAVLETRMDPLLNSLETINTRLGAMQKTQDSLLIEIRIHMSEDDR